jgi:hypothetical protein
MLILIKMSDIFILSASNEHDTLSKGNIIIYQLILLYLAILSIKLSPFCFDIDCI